MTRAEDAYQRWVVLAPKDRTEQEVFEAGMREALELARDEFGDNYPEGFLDESVPHSTPIELPKKEESK